MPPEHSAPKEYLRLYRDGSLGTALIEAIDELIIAGRFPIIPGAALDHPINLISEPTGSEAANPIDLTGTTTTTESSSPTISTNTSTSTPSSSSSSTTPTDPRPQPKSQPQPNQSLTTLTHKLTNHLLTTFDRVIAQTLAAHDEVVKRTPAIKMKGRLKLYGLVDDVWNFRVEDVEVVVGPSRGRGRRGGNERGGRAGGRGGGQDVGGKRKRDGDGDGDGAERAEGDERAGKRRRGDNGEARAVDGGEGQGKEDVGGGNGGGPGVIKVDKLLIVACDGRGEGSGEGKRRKQGG